MASHRGSTWRLTQCPLQGAAWSRAAGKMASWLGLQPDSSRRDFLIGGFKIIACTHDYRTAVRFIIILGEN